MSAPGYWMNETSGVLRPAVMAYLHGEEMTVQQVVTLRAYIRQWIMAPGFVGPEVEELRGRVDGLQSREAIARWLDDADAAGVDPL